MQSQQDRTGAEPVLPPGTSVLIVEDQPPAARAMAAAIEALGGIALEIAASVEEGLAACARGGFEVALLAIKLEGRRSTPVAAALASARKPFLILSDHAPVKIAGFDDVPVLTRPYSLRQLANALAALLRRAVIHES